MNVYFQIYLKSALQNNFKTSYPQDWKVSFKATAFFLPNGGSLLALLFLANQFFKNINKLSTSIWNPNTLKQ